MHLEEKPDRIYMDGLIFKSFTWKLLVLSTVCISLEYWDPGKKAVARIYTAVSISYPSVSTSYPSLKGHLTWEKTVGA